MKHCYPAYYKIFRCIAAACPDSCCQGWDVVIDSDTEAFYQTVQGEFGSRLRAAVYTDGDGDRVFHLSEGKKCPFWGEDHLCDIYRTLGEKHLCATCALFPRIKMDYTVFTEHTLALACPEAARLILHTDNAYTDFTLTDPAPCAAYDADIMRFLLQARQQAAHILSQTSPLSDRLNALLQLAQTAQAALGGAAPAEPFEFTQLPAVYAGLDYIDEDNRERITAAASDNPDLGRYEPELTRLGLYYLYRYLLGAIDSLDLLAPLRFLAASVRTVASLAERSSLSIVTAAQHYSKEIEQSYENMEALYAFFT